MEGDPGCVCGWGVCVWRGAACVGLGHLGVVALVIVASLVSTTQPSDPPPTTRPPPRVPLPMQVATRPLIGVEEEASELEKICFFARAEVDAAAHLTPVLPTADSMTGPGAVGIEEIEDEGYGSEVDGEKKQGSSCPPHHHPPHTQTHTHTHMHACFRRPARWRSFLMLSFPEPPGTRAVLERPISRS